VNRQSVMIQIAIALLTAARSPADAQTLEGFSSLPADTFAPGPTSGQLIAPTNGRAPPFVDQQPVQGFSSVLRAPNGEFLAMPDNGFGQKGNWADYVLRLYRIAPDFATKNRGSGVTTLKSYISLRDPGRKIPFPIVADGDVYPNSSIPVDPAIRQQRLLTGGDFDVESVRAEHDGTLWFGDEFGPFLLHTSADGTMLDAPYALPGVMSPQNQKLGTAMPNLPRSKGFEGMADHVQREAALPDARGSIDDGPRSATPHHQPIRSRDAHVHPQPMVLSPGGRHDHRPVDSATSRP
jgi:hypothetical protein